VSIRRPAIGICSRRRQDSPVIRQLAGAGQVQFSQEEHGNNPFTAIHDLRRGSSRRAAHPANAGRTNGKRNHAINLCGRKCAGKFGGVINLAPPEYDTAVEAEGALLGKAGVVYLNIPVAWGNPTHEDFALFSQVLKAAGQRKVLVHCQVNLRGSSFTFLYRVIHEGAPVNDSLAKLTGVWTPNPIWKKFIESELAASGRKIELF
jgi:protein tyrosine phosphatase (PTP) superfamily phosphohydrolase (DUF442 family)